MIICEFVLPAESLSCQVCFLGQRKEKKTGFCVKGNTTEDFTMSLWSFFKKIFHTSYNYLIIFWRSIL